MRIALRIYSIRPMIPDDFNYIGVPRGRTTIAHIRDSHHNIARFAAIGLEGNEIARRCGYSRSRVSILLRDPSMQELVAKYRGKVDAAFLESLDDFTDLSKSTMMKSAAALHDRIDDDPSQFTNKELIALVGDHADRFGYGKRSTSVNLNVDFAAKLEDAIRRSRPQLKVIDNEAA